MNLAAASDAFRSLRNRRVPLVRTDRHPQVQQVAPEQEPNGGPTHHRDPRGPPAEGTSQSQPSIVESGPQGTHQDAPPSQFRPFTRSCEPPRHRVVTPRARPASSFGTYTFDQLHDSEVKYALRQRPARRTTFHRNVKPVAPAFQLTSKQFDKLLQARHPGYAPLRPSRRLPTFGGELTEDPTRFLDTCERIFVEYQKHCLS